MDGQEKVTVELDAADVKKLSDTAETTVCARCGGTRKLECERCHYGGTWLHPVVGSKGPTDLLYCARCGHTQPALCCCQEGPS